MHENILFLGLKVRKSTFSCIFSLKRRKFADEQNARNMKKNLIIGRNKEKAELQRCLESNRSELIIVYGRRRVGKTYLVDEFFQQKYDFTFVGGHNLPQRTQLRSFAKALEAATGKKTERKLTDWFDAFDVLEDYLTSLPTDRKKVIFIDEMPWIDSLRSDFTAAFENFWNGWAARRHDIVFIASGSATSWMVDKLVENQGGLHARITCQIYLRPFSLNETELYLKSRGCLWDRFQIAQCYMFFGGVPFYLSLLDPSLSLVQNVDALCFAKGGTLRQEFEGLYYALFAHADNYIKIVRFLASHKGGMTYAKIAKGTGIDGQRLTKILKNLERCDFIMKFKFYGKKTQDRLYKLVDFYTLFYLKYIEPNIDSFDEQWWSNHYLSHSVEAWQGLTFELLCLFHIRQIRTALNIGGVASEAYAWFDKADKDKELRGSQIDLIIERADRVINLCEMKFCQAQYKITADYEMKLRNRMALFRESTHSTKSLVNTFVTTFGVANGIHSGIVNSEVTLDGLFTP